MVRMVLEVRGLTKSLAGRPILSHISFALRAERSLVVMGSNGAGKSTLLLVLGGVLGYDGGTLARFGRIVPPEGITDGRIGYLGHRSLMYPNLTLADNLNLYARLWRVPDAARCIERAAERVGLSLWQHEPLTRYSQGMRQRAAWARLLLIEPELWLLDEPLAGLDPEGRQLVAGLLAEHLARGAAAVVTSHRWQDAPQLGHMAAVLQNGQLGDWRPVAESTPTEEPG